MIILLNGPPRCGKDSIGKALSGFEVEKFAKPLKDMIKVTYPNLPTDWDEERKDDPIIYSYTPRSIQIEFSENFLKRLHGKYIFGRLLNDRLKVNTNYVITDAGFPEEVQYLINRGLDCRLFHIYRDGCSFLKDSRDYIDVLTPVAIWNNGTIEEAVQEILSYV